MELLPHVPILVNETGHLLLQPVILLHQAPHLTGKGLYNGISGHFYNIWR